MLSLSTKLKALKPWVLAVPTAFVLASSANAATSFTLSPTPADTPASSFTDTVDSVGLTVSGGTGVDLPTAGAISGNSNGICSFLTNSASTGGRRCGYTASVPGTSVNSVLNSIDLKFDTAVRLVDFFAQTNAVSVATMTFSGGSLNESFTINSPGGNYLFTSPLFLPANTTITVTTSGVSLLPGFDSGAVRIRHLTVDVPAPLPILGAAAAFSSRRRLRLLSQLATAKSTTSLP